MVIDLLLSGVRPVGRICLADFKAVLPELVRRGYTDGQIACLVGRSRRRVMTARRRLNLPGQPVGVNQNTRPERDAPSIPRSAN